MKKILIIVAIIVALLLGAILCIPFFFKDQIVNIAKKEINSSVNGDVNFENVDLSILKTFPNLGIDISKLSIVGHAPFQGDTLMYVNKFTGVVNIWKAIKGEYEIIKIGVYDSKINIITNAKGQANYDISKTDTPADTATSKDAENAETAFKVQLKSFVIQNANITYMDSVGKMSANLANLNVNLSGDFSADQSQLNLKSSIESLLYTMDGTNYISNASVKFDSKINADFKNSKYTFLDNSLFINRFEMGIEGWVQQLSTATAMDLKFGAKQTSFDALLELIPDAYKSYIKGIDTKGDFLFKGYAKGNYTDTAYPEFGLTANVKNGYIKYPDLPESLNDINMDLNISHPNATDLDAMVIAINNLSFNAVGNQFKSNWIFKTPISDLSINGNIDGNIDLMKLSKALPLGAMKMDGLIKAKIAIDGRMSQIDKQQYDKFKASGFLSLDQFNLQTPDLSVPVKISTASMNFTPQAINLDKMDMTIGKSDFHLAGNITNYIGYLFKDGTINGNFKYYSKLLNANELMNLSSSTPQTPAKTEKADTAASDIQIPKNINFSLNTKIDQMVYDNLIITNTQGDISLKESKAQLSNVITHLLDGSLTLDGVYNAQNPKSHSAQMEMKINNFNIQKTATALPTVAKMAPIMKKIQGDVSAKVDFTSLFDAKQEVIMSSINSKGNLNTSAITINNVDVLDQLATKLNLKNLSSLNAKPTNINFKIQNGNVVIDTFPCTLNNYNVTSWGTYGLDQNINYFLRVPVPAENLGSEASKLLGSLGSSVKEIPVTVNFKGNIASPTFSLDLSEAQKTIQAEVKTKATNKAKDVLGGFLNKIK